MQPSLMINETPFQFKSASFNSINIREINLHGAFSFPFLIFFFIFYFCFQARCLQQEVVLPVHRDFNTISTEETALWLNSVTQKKREEKCCKSFTNKG